MKGIWGDFLMLRGRFLGSQKPSETIVFTMLFWCCMFFRLELKNLISELQKSPTWSPEESNIEAWGTKKEIRKLNRFLDLKKVTKMTEYTH